MFAAGQLSPALPADRIDLRSGAGQFEGGAVLEARFHRPQVSEFLPRHECFQEVRINRKGHHPLMPAFAFKPNHLLVAAYLDFHAPDIVIACLGRLHDEDQSCLRIASDEVADIYRRVPVFAKARSDRAGICFVKRFPGCRRFLFLCMRRRLSGEAG
jgi:hypothetical protein